MVNAYEKPKSYRVFFSDFIIMAWSTSAVHALFGVLIILHPNFLLLPGNLGVPSGMVMLSLSFMRIVEASRDSKGRNALGDAREVKYLDPLLYRFNKNEIEFGDGFAWLRKHRQAMEELGYVQGEEPERKR